jgi:hypothetical protein
MAELTYIFGAGASFNSMPLVENFPDRFDYFMGFVGKVTDGAKKDFFLKDCADFSRNVKVHLSFDTFFKKLFHQGEKEKIQDYKAIILIFFLFEHLMNLDEIRNSQNALVKGKMAIVDPRYEALIAGLLKPIMGQSELYINVNFITWNYDLNLLGSIKNFFSKNNHLNSFIQSNNSDENIFSIGEQVTVIHLNGFVTHKKINDLLEISDSDMTAFLSDLIDNYTTSRGEISQYSKYINFSWESINITGELPSFVQRAQEAVKRSNNIVVIGYSFPLYNRLIDAKLLNRSTLNRKQLTVQDPNAAVLQEVLKSDFAIVDSPELASSGIPTTVIKIVENCNSFFVPNNIFSSELIHSNS